MIAAEFDRLLPARPATDVSLLALKLMGMLDASFAGRGEPFDPSHSNVYCLTTAFTSPWLDVHSLHLATKIWVWLTAVDDTADTLCESADALRVSIDRCLDVIGGKPPETQDPLAICLAEIRDELSRYPLFHQLAPLWRDTAERFVSAIYAERVAADEWFAGGVSPDVAEHLERATDSIATPFYTVSLWTMMSEPDLPTDVYELMPAVRESALAIRLGNDLRSQAREAACGNVNMLGLGIKAPEQLAHELRVHAENSHGLLQPFADYPAAIALDRLTTWCVRLYERIDFRTPEIWEDS